MSLATLALLAMMFQTNHQGTPKNVWESEYPSYASTLTSAHTCWTDGNHPAPTHSVVQRPGGTVEYVGAQATTFALNHMFTKGKTLPIGWTVIAFCL